MSLIQRTLELGIWGGSRARMGSEVFLMLRNASSLPRDDKCGHRAINIQSGEKMDREKSLAVTKSPRS